ncbi:mobile mystery protein B [Mucilaginibacter ginkgonis]|uniref:Mobile mystery protein B n=1 Tax=Mucilaginibacter ginkgonis TaxID=2682091 RepID=A0A6I4HWS8_9SPHI|nr:mobile mystery protein B [Mucilaginibacter ginkgonis]QQL49956.1 mobile mystery protein B [Mucilaginibacter ginkgonis]
MGIELIYTEGQTPLGEEEKDGLLIGTITTKGELDEFEQLNIQKAVEWSLGKRLKAEQIFTESFLLQLHKRMYGDVWAWAGKFRKTDKNIGVSYYKVGPELRNLLDDVKYWVENGTYKPDEIAIRFKHRIVAIHCFPNGNGRHSRLVADIIIEKIFREAVYSWGSSALLKDDDLRKSYIQSLKSADRGDIGPLITFARS